MAPCTDLYADLGLAPGADSAAVRQAFRRLAFDLHPDRNPDPRAAEAFRRIRAAYEALLDPAHREALEAEEIVEAAMRAAGEAARTRVQTQQEPAPVGFPLDPGRRGLAPAVAVRVALACVVAAVFAVTLAVLAEAVFVLAGAACLAAAPAVWLTRRQPATLHLYGNGYEDDRWPEAGRIGWGDVYALDPDYTAGTLDLALSEPVAARLARVDDRPCDTLVWQGDRPFYRLPLGDQLCGVLRVVEARTGLRVP
jgi:hypothetical protein